MKTISLEQIREMKNRGELSSSAKAAPGPELGPDFWDDAQIVKPSRRVSVHLRIDADVLEHFKRGGRGHVQRMQDVLRSYVAHANKKGA